MANIVADSKYRMAVFNKVHYSRRWHSQQSSLQSSCGKSISILSSYDAYPIVVVIPVKCEVETT